MSSNLKGNVTIFLQIYIKTDVEIEEKTYRCRHCALNKSVDQVCFVGVQLCQGAFKECQMGQILETSLLLAALLWNRLKPKGFLPNTVDVQSNKHNKVDNSTIGAENDLA